MALYGSLWLPLWLSRALTATLWHTMAPSGSLLLSNFAYTAPDRLTGPLLGSQRRCHDDALSLALILTTSWLYSNYILTKFLVYSYYILATFWLHSGLILAIFWIHSGYILDTFWLKYDYILTTFCIHSAYILTTFWPFWLTDWLTHWLTDWLDLKQSIDLKWLFNLVPLFMILLFC